MADRRYALVNRATTAANEAIDVRLTEDETVTGSWDFMSRVRFYDSGGTDYAEFEHDGTDFNTTLTGTTDWNISGGDVFLVGDNQKLKFGIGNDLQIYSDGTDGVVDCSGDVVFNTRVVYSAASNNVTLRDTVTSTTNSNPTIRFETSDEVSLGFFGFNSTSDTNFRFRNQIDSGEIQIQTTDNTSTTRTAFRMGGNVAATALAFHGTAPIVQPTVTGSRGGNAALASLLTTLVNYGLIVDATT